MSSKFEGFQETGREQIQGPTGGAFQDAYQSNWQGQGQVQKGQFNEQQANEQGYLNVPENSALYALYNQGGGGAVPRASEGMPDSTSGSMPQTYDGMPMGTGGGSTPQTYDGMPTGTGGQGQFVPNGPEGPNGQEQYGSGVGWQHGGHKWGHAGHGHHSPLQQLNSDLKGLEQGNNALTSSIQTIEQKSREGHLTTEQDLRLQNAKLAYDNATGDTSGVTAAKLSIKADQGSLLTNETKELRSIYGKLTKDQLKQLTTELTTSQQRLLTASPQPGTPQDLMLQNVKLELAVVGGSNSASAVQTAQNAITSDQETLLTNMVRTQQTRFSNLQTSNPTEFAQLTSNLKNRVATKLSGNDSTSIAPATTSTTDGSTTV